MKETCIQRSSDRHWSIWNLARIFSSPVKSNEAKREVTDIYLNQMNEVDKIEMIHLMDMKSRNAFQCLIEKILSE